MQFQNLVSDSTDKTPNHYLKLNQFPTDLSSFCEQKDNYLNINRITDIDIVNDFFVIDLDLELMFREDSGEPLVGSFVELSI
jgi:hypothetical protein